MFPLPTLNPTKMKKILLDNGHGIETPGKRSPDGVLREYAYNREIARAIHQHLQLRGIESELVVPEETDVSLYERCRRINVAAMRNGIADTAVISIHVNAAGNGSQWMNATGWCAYTSPGETEADKIAKYLYRAARHYLPGHKIRCDHSDGDPDFEAPFYLLKHTYCPAVLTENLFMDAYPDYQFLMSNAGKRSIVNLHVEGIIDYLRFAK